jgi:hypothetical protein
MPKIAPLILWPTCHTQKKTKKRQNGLSIGSPKKNGKSRMFPMSAYLRNVSNPRHLLTELIPETLDEGGPITEPKNIVSTRIQHTLK